METPVYVIDTHPLVWYFADSPRLSSVAKKIFEQIENGNAIGVVPTIVLAEIVHLADKRKIPISVKETITRLKQAVNFGIVSLDLMVIVLMIPLTSYEIHDRVIIQLNLLKLPLLQKMKISKNQAQYHVSGKGCSGISYY